MLMWFHIDYIRPNLDITSFPTPQMGKLKKSYSERVGVPVTSLRFLFDGRRINDDETPKALEMEQVGDIHFPPR